MTEDPLNALSTPRTDEAEYHSTGDNYLYVVDSDFARRLERELQALQRAQEWQPIETAPKDGRRIILGYAGSYSEEGYWLSDPSKNYWGETGWFATDENVLSHHPSNPTHWMPLPEPPSLRQSTRETST